jgi:hypothetical protein
LDVLPHVVNIEYFKDKSFTGKSKEQGYNYYTLGYIHSVNLCIINDDEVDIKAKFIILSNITRTHVKCLHVRTMVCLCKYTVQILIRICTLN